MPEIEVYLAWIVGVWLMSHGRATDTVRTELVLNEVSQRDDVVPAAQRHYAASSRIEATVTTASSIDTMRW